MIAAVKCAECGSLPRVDQAAFGGAFSPPKTRMKCRTWGCWEGPEKESVQEAVRAWNRRMGGQSSEVAP